MKEIGGTTKGLIFDGHNDTMYMMYVPGEKIRPLLEKTDSGHIDLPRAKMGGFCGGLFAICIPHPEQEIQIHAPDIRPAIQRINLKSVDFAYAHQLAKRAIEGIWALQTASSEQLKVVCTIEEIYAALDENVLSVVIHLEGAEPIDPQLESLDDFYNDGVRSIGIVWSRENAFGHGVNFEFPRSPDMGPGLTECGKALVRACNQLGIMVDLSHLNEKGFWDTEKISQAPLVASHSCVHALCPSPRNLTDKQLDAIGASEGVVGVTFGVMFVRGDGEENPNTPLQELVRHFHYIADRIGIDHLAIGSDFDGTTIPQEIGDVTGLPRLLDALRDSGFNEEELNKIRLENWLRVLSQTWK